jgi:signal transduction histidine kinase
MARVPAWFTPFCDQALLARRQQHVCGPLLGALPLLALALDQRLPGRASLSGLAILAVLAAGWTLRCWLLLPVLAAACASQVVYAALGELEPVTLAIRLATLFSVAAVSRLGVLGWTHVRDARHHEMTTLLHVSHAMATSADLERVVAEAVRAAARTVSRPGLAGGRPAALLRVGDGAVTVAGACDATGVPPGGASGESLGPPAAAVVEALESGRPAVVTAYQCPGLRGLPAAGDATAWALARVAVAGEPFGVLAVASPHPSEFRPEDLRLLDGIARVAGLAITIALRHGELDEVKGRLQRSVTLALEAGRSLEAADVTSSIVVRVAEGAGADQATLARLEDGHLVVECTYWATGGRPTPVGRRFSADEAAAVPDLARALASGHPLATGPLDAGSAGRDLAGTLGAGRHTLLFPFAVAGAMTCLLVLVRHGDRPFAPADLARLAPMADVALLALRNAHLYARAERAQLDASTSSGRLRLAIEAAEDIGSSPELAEVLDGVLRRAVEVAHAERGTISRATSGRMVVECEHDPAGTHVGTGAVWTLEDSGVAAEAVRSGRPVQGGRSATLPPELARWGARARVEHLIACPLTVGRELVGVLGLSRRREPFAEADLLTLQPFATLAALLLRNARLLAEARQVGQAKSSFLNLAAHELRTPLAVIKGYLSMLEDGTFQVPGETGEAVAILVAKARELESLVEALLVTARLETGGVPPRPDRLDAGEAVRQALDRIAPRARLEGARLEARLAEDQAIVHADGGHVARILDNLLNNALTYSHSPARVTVAVRRRGAVEIVVRDQGMGIPADQHDRVFERFHRLDSDSSRFSPGLGLGLSISRELALVNDGSLCLEASAPGEGSTFVLRLPAREAPSVSS